VDTPVPRLAGRQAADIVAQMQAFKTGQKPSTVMDRIVKGLTDAEVEAIAAWHAQQK
jgi:cytochrome c553